MTNFDTWFFKQATYEDDFWYKFCPEGEPELMKNGDFNCTVCDAKDCEYWHEYNS